MWKKAELRIPKKLRRDAGVWLPKNKHQMQEVGQLAIDIIRRRMLKDERDGRGRLMPKLTKRKYANSWFYTSPNDTRFGGLLKRTSWTYSIEEGKSKKRGVALVYADGYAALKQKMTGKNSKRKTGYLTGDMWKGLSQTLQKKRGGWAIKLHFLGGTRVGKTQKFIKRKVKQINRETNKVEVVTVKVPKMATNTIKNRDKAEQLQKRGKTPVVSLLSMTQLEIAQCMDLYTSLIKPFGEHTNYGPQGFSTKMFRKGRTL